MPGNWREIFLDSEAAHIWGAELGFDLRGDNPGSVLDRTWSYRHPGNHGLYRAWLAGLLDNDHWRELRG